MRLGCIVLAHRGPSQLALMLSKIQHPDVRIYLHLDAQAPQGPFDAAIERAGVLGVASLERRHSRWGGIEVVDATLEGLRKARADGCDYFVLLSGQDFPVMAIGDTVDFFRSRPDRSFVSSFPLPAAHWRFGGRDRTDFYTYTVRGRRETCVPRGEDVRFSWKGWALNSTLRLRTAMKPPRRFPEYARPLGGSQWWNLSRSAVDHVLGFLDEHPDYRRYHEHTLLPDEMFFQSILLGTTYHESHEVVNDALRYMVWLPGTSHPKILGMEDLEDMRGSGKPFARKFDMEHDARVLEAL